MAENKSPVKKSRLTVRHWLNIIIISVSAMLLLSVLIGRMVNKAENNQSIPVEQNNIKKQAAISKLDFGKFQLINQNGVWRRSDNKTTHLNLSVVVKKWQSLLVSQGTPMEGASAKGQTVLVFLDNKQQPIIAKINLGNDKLSISFITVGVEFLLPAADYPLYFPSDNSQGV